MFLRRSLALLALALVVTSAGAEKPKAKKATHPAGYTWEPNFEAARLKAAEQGKLLFIDFYTDW